MQEVRQILAGREHRRGPLEIAVASGKGGVGKTTVAMALARMLAGRGVSAAYVDCDVENPNGHLFLNPEWEYRQPVSRQVPVVDPCLCPLCGECEKVCQFGAIVVLPTGVHVLADLCKSCGACVTACPDRALSEREHVVGDVAAGRADDLWCCRGRLNTGEQRAVPVVEATRDAAAKSDAAVLVLDAPPGTSCPTVATVRRTDLVLLVSDATPFGRHDVALAREMVRELAVPAVEIINRCDLGVADEEGGGSPSPLPVAARIPFSRRLALSYANGDFESIHRELGGHLEPLVDCFANHLAGERV